MSNLKLHLLNLWLFLKSLNTGASNVNKRPSEKKPCAAGHARALHLLWTWHLELKWVPSRMESAVSEALHCSRRRTPQLCQTSCPSNPVFFLIVATEQPATNHHPNNHNHWIIGMLDQILLPITIAYTSLHEFVQSFFFNMLMPFGSAISQGSTFQTFTTSCTNKYFTYFRLIFHLLYWAPARSNK